jgi:5'-nucleotidase
LNKVCLTNDDGPQSTGLQKLANALKQSMDLAVIVPDGQRSATGKALTFNRPLRITEKDADGYRLILHDGTPADSVCIAQSLIENIELFISGINTGANVGYQSMFSSGTVGAVMEAALQGYPGIAVSRVAETKDWFNSTGIQHEYEKECRIALEIAQHVLDKRLPEGIDALNLNFPSIMDENSSLVITKPTRVRMRNDLERRVDPNDSPYFWVRGIETDPRPNTDVYEVLIKRNVSISPIIIESTKDPDLEKLSEFLGDYKI